MSTVTLVITPVATNLAPGQVLSDWSFVVADGAGTAIQAVKQPSPTFVFDLSVPGVYTANAVRLDNTGANFGNVVTASFTIPTSGATQGDAAAALTVVLS